MGLLQNISRFLGINQVVEPQDVEKVTRQSAQVQQTPYSNRGLSPRSPSFKTSINTTLKGVPIHPQSSTYRFLPIISGILIPFSILLSLPSLTDPWYIRTDENSMTIESRPNSQLLNLGMGFSMACSVLANICLIVRFTERKVLGMTWLCILFLTLHDLINIITVTIFGVRYHSNDGLIFGQSFWFAIWSTIASTITNITIIVDYSRTKDFANSGSGLTNKQRSLVIIIIILLCYLGLGSLVQTFMLSISFIDAIYFSIVSIETIGFGDIRPTTNGTRTFTCFFVAGGILNLALAVALIREVVLEGVALGFQARVKAIRTRQRERRIRTRWRTAVKLRLRDNNLPMWIVDKDGEYDEQDWQYHHHHRWWKWARHGWNLLKKRLSRESVDKRLRKRRHLNLGALTKAQMEEAALEAGAPLADLLPPGLQLAGSDDMEGEDEDEIISDQGGVPFMHSTTIQDEANLENTVVAGEKIAFVARLTVALLVFTAFWMAGSIIFMATENWGFGRAVYFCFIAFTTVGYGDYSPRTPAGRSIFVAWALLGVATMTILISILVEAYSTQFKTMIRTEIPPDDVNTPQGSGTRQIRFLDRMENAGTKEELISPRSASAILSATSSATGHRDWEPSLAPIPEDGSWKHNTEVLHEILRHAQSLRTLIAPENWPGDGNPIESTTSSTADLGPQVTAVTALSNTQGQRREDHKCQIEKTTQEIITAALCALEVLNGAGGKKTKLTTSDQ